MALLVTANPKLFSKFTDPDLSESVVKVSENSKFTRLDIREQCRIIDSISKSTTFAGFSAHHEPSNKAIKHFATNRGHVIFYV